MYIYLYICIERALCIYNSENWRERERERKKLSNIQHRSLSNTDENYAINLYVYAYIDRRTQQQRERRKEIFWIRVLGRGESN